MHYVLNEVLFLHIVMQEGFHITVKPVSCDLPNKVTSDGGH